jgi:hypothetical protein
MPYQTTTNLYQNTKYVVDANGGTPYTTIQSALTAANAASVPATVYIRQGTYTENLTLYDDIILEGADPLVTVNIIGKHTPPLAGSLVLKNLTFTSATHILDSAGAGSTNISFDNCSINITSGYIANLTNWTGFVAFTQVSDGSTNNGVFNNTATASCYVTDCPHIGAGTAHALTINGQLLVYNSNIGCSIALSGAVATSSIRSGSRIDGTITVSATAGINIIDSFLIPNGSDKALNITTTTPILLQDVGIVSSNALAIDGTGTIEFANVSFGSSHGIAGTITQILTAVSKTGEIHAENIQNEDQSGFFSWAAGGPYFDDTTLGTFQLLVGGTGYIRGKLVTWVAQNITGMTSGSTWFIYIDATGTIGKTSTRTDALYENNIVLFECLYDETSGTKQQHTVKENHPYNHQSAVSNYEHDVIGTVINNAAQGANITLVGPANVKIAIAGADVLEDHGLETDIPDSGGAGVVFKRFYTTAAGKWAVQNTSDTFAGYYNNAGTPTAIPANKYGIYRLYVSKDNLNATTPTYYAVLDTTYYNNAAAANTAISSNTPASATNELAGLEMAQLGFIVWEQAIAQISTVFIAKATLRGTISTGTTNVAALVTTNTSAFNGILSAADTNVQAALDTIDNWGAGTTDKCLVVGNGAGSALGVLAVGGTGTILTGVAANDPTWTTATYPADVNKGDVLVASADHVIGIVAGATTAGYMLTANGAATAPTFQTPSGVIWAVEAADMGAVANRGYIANKAGALTFTLPAACAVGKTFRFTGINTATGWKIAQNAGQTIYFGATATTTGAAGYLQSTAIRDSVELVCVVADTDFNVVSSIGNITVA